MNDILIVLLLFLVVVILISVTAKIAKKRELKCKKCGSEDVVRTGNRREIDRTRKPFFGPGSEYEYKCKKCKNVYWTSVESVFEI